MPRESYLRSSRDRRYVRPADWLSLTRRSGLRYRAEVVANCLDLFQIVVPRAVEAEILAPQTGCPIARVSVRHAFSDTCVARCSIPRQRAPPLDRFGVGEAEAITLAQRLMRFS